MPEAEAETHWHLDGWTYWRRVHPGGEWEIVPGPEVPPSVVAFMSTQSMN
jgi:hypothetical protein